MKVKSESEVAQLCPTLSDPMDCSLPDSSIHGIFQARALEWGAITFSIVTILFIVCVCVCVCVIRAPEICSFCKAPVLNTININNYMLLIVINN